MLSVSYVLDALTRRASPTAALNASKTKITMAARNIIIEWELRNVIVAVMNNESSMPSGHRRVDMR